MPRRTKAKPKNPPRLIFCKPTAQPEILHRKAVDLNRKIIVMTKGRKRIMKRLLPDSSTMKERQMIINDMNQAIREKKMELDKIRKRINQLAAQKNG